MPSFFKSSKKIIFSNINYLNLVMGPIGVLGAIYQAYQDHLRICHDVERNKLLQIESSQKEQIFKQELKQWYVKYEQELAEEDKAQQRKI